MSMEMTAPVDFFVVDPSLPVNPPVWASGPAGAPPPGAPPPGAPPVGPGSGAADVSEMDSIIVDKVTKILNLINAS